jgi:KDO2-lipid IV(A) lauroyltransferase
MGYYLALPFIYLLSILPFPILYAVSDFMYLVVYRLLRYRRAVVEQNLRNSFPEKSEEEIQRISRAYYHYMCDLMLETFKTLTMSRKEAVKRCKFNDLSLLQSLHDEKKDIIIVMGHYGNWEWAGSSMSLETNYQLYVIYHPLSDKRFNKLIYHMRTRFGTRLIAMNNTFRDMVKNRGTISATAFIADQTPSPDNAYWTTFLNQDTPIFEGTEKIARKLNYPVVFGNVKRVKRGYYEVFTEMLVEDPASTKDGEISELHTKRLEAEIRLQPEIWLWSHKRWKHKRPAHKVALEKAY